MGYQCLDTMRHYERLINSIIVVKCGHKFAIWEKQLQQMCMGCQLKSTPPKTANLAIWRPPGHQIGSFGVTKIFQLINMNLQWFSQVFIFVTQSLIVSHSIQILVSHGVVSHSIQHQYWILACLMVGVLMSHKKSQINCMQNLRLFQIMQ